MIRCAWKVLRSGHRSSMTFRRSRCTPLVGASVQPSGPAVTCRSRFSRLRSLSFLRLVAASLLEIAVAPAAARVSDSMSTRPPDSRDQNSIFQPLDCTASAFYLHWFTPRRNGLTQCRNLGTRAGQRSADHCGDGPTLRPAAASSQSGFRSDIRCASDC